MSFQSRRELLVTVVPRYKEAGRKQKMIILNEFIATTGYSRKYAIRLLSQLEIPTAKKIKRPRPRFYSKAVQDALLVVWAASNYIASKRLSPFLTELVPALERHGHLDLTDPVRLQLMRVSPATIDRLLKSWRNRNGIKGLSLTRSGKLLKNQIQVRTFADWEDNRPGFFEADLVAHCGCNAGGSYLHTLVLTDIATGWVECLPLLHRSAHAVICALDRARQLIPFPILGIDTDNGSEFINLELISYCDKNKITFTRGRAYKKNDQCFVEQKNGVIVRQLIGYDRFDGLRAHRQLAELYRAVRLYINFFQPSMKLINKQRDDGKTRRKYDTAKTPFKRLCATDVIEAKYLEKIDTIYQALDPVRLLKQIKALQDALWKHAIFPKQLNQSQELGKTVISELAFSPDSCMAFPSTQGNLGDNIIVDYKKRNQNRYRRSKKPKIQRWWRTRKDPFEQVWSEVRSWLEHNPERTSKSLLEELKNRCPNKFNDSHLRTLQRYVKRWRSEAILSFNDDFLIEGRQMSENLSPLSLRAFVFDRNNPAQVSND
jgi:hypothetical protein